MFGFDDSPICVVTLVISSVNWNNQYPIARERSYILVDSNFSDLMYCWWSQGARRRRWDRVYLTEPQDAQLWSEPHLVNTLTLNTLNTASARLHQEPVPVHCRNLKGTWERILLFAIMWNTLTLQRPKLKSNKTRSPGSSGLRRRKTFSEDTGEPGDCQSGGESDVKPNGNYKSWLNNIKQWRKKWLKNEINFPPDTFSKSPSASGSRESLDQVRYCPGGVSLYQ